MRSAAADRDFVFGLVVSERGLPVVLQAMKFNPAALLQAAWLRGDGGSAAPRRDVLDTGGGRGLVVMRPSVRTMAGVIVFVACTFGAATLLAGTDATERAGEIVLACGVAVIGMRKLAAAVPDRLPDAGFMVLAFETAGAAIMGNRTLHADEWVSWTLLVLMLTYACVRIGDCWRDRGDVVRQRRG